MWKRWFGAACLFVLDLSIVYIATLLFSIHLSLFLFVPLFPGVRYSHPPLFLCLALVALYKLLGALLRRRGHSRAAAVLGAGFLGFFTLAAAVSLALSGRLVWFEIAFPKVLAVFAALAALAACALVWRLWRWRTVPLFLVLVLSFNFLVLRVSRYTIQERDLLPLSSPGVRVLMQIDDPDPPAPGGHPPGMNDRLFDLLHSFAGFLMASRQFGYVYADPAGRSLYVSDLSVRAGTTAVFRIRLEDLVTMGAAREKGYFRDMILDRRQQQLITTNSMTGDLCTYRADDLARVSCVNLGVPSLINVREMPDGGLVVSSEHGFITWLRPDRTVLRRTRPPLFCEEIELDKTGRRLMIASMGGYTLGELDTRDGKLVHRALPSVMSCGIALDPGRNRVFLPRLLLGDLLVLDGDSLETVARVPLSPGLRDTVYIPERDLVAVGNYFNGELYLLDGDGYRVAGTLWAGSKNRSLAYSPERDRLYAQTANRILEIDLDRALAPASGEEGPPPDRGTP